MFPDRSLFKGDTGSGNEIVIFQEQYITMAVEDLACVQTSPISLLLSEKGCPFSERSKEIGDVCTQAIEDFILKSYN